MAFSELSTLARNKMHSSVSSKEKSCSLHRWVLLKNSLIHSTPCLPSSTAHSGACTPVKLSILDHQTDDVDEDEDDDSFLDGNSFMFPDAGQLGEKRVTSGNASEAAWLDSLLQSLGDDEDEEEDLAISRTSDLPVEDDEELLLSPSLSPMSSSDDLPGGHSAYLPTPISVTYSYPVPYPPFHPPQIHSYDFESPNHASLPSFRQYEDPLPYYEADDIDNLSVPDAIEDLSDDESDAPSTPSLGSRSSLTDPASIPSPIEASPAPHFRPHVYIDNQDSYFYPFELDPLPFSDALPHHSSYDSHLQEC
ncbi:hypothetical protein ONZ45_g2244 [Pleurotus djamor]|nr:hypothetical protein ONZ45_g2244 [Pleurotus djamor]